MVHTPDVVVGFRDRPAIAHALADAMGAHLVFAEESSYQGGEMAVRTDIQTRGRAIIASDVTERPESLFRVLLAASALRNVGARRVELVAPWIAYGRQDRAVQDGEAPAGIAVAQMLSQHLDRIITLDAHSPVFARAFGGRLENVRPVSLIGVGRFIMVTLVVAPDRGATTRAKEVAKMLRVPCITVDKRREGQEVVSRLEVPSKKMEGAHVLIVDDMADSGRTLEAAACAARLAGATTVRAHVTHAFDLSRLSDKLIMCARVSCAYDHAAHRLSSVAIDALASRV